MVGNSLLRFLFFYSKQKKSKVVTLKWMYMLKLKKVWLLRMVKKNGIIVFLRQRGKHSF